MKKDKWLEAKFELWDSESHLENINLFDILNSLYKEKYIDDIEFSEGKSYLLNSRFIKKEYNDDYLRAIPILHKALQYGFIDDVQYHQAVPLVIQGSRDKYMVRMLFAGLISFKEFMAPRKSRLLKWINNNNIVNFGVVKAHNIALECAERYGYRMYMYHISLFKNKLEIIMKKEALIFKICQVHTFFGKTKVYIVTADNHKYTWDNYQKLL